jgi:amino acid adenylation domain-containing protein
MQTHILENLEQGPLKHHGAHQAIIEGNKSISYSDLVHKSQRWATQLNLRDERTRCPIAIFLPRSIDAVTADIACLYSGNFYTNLDFNSPPERLRGLLENVNPIAVITNMENVERLKSMSFYSGMIISIEELETDSEVSVNHEVLNEIRSRHIDTDPMCLVNTSGSTGVPKSVVISHRSVIDYVDWWTDRFSFSESEKFGSMTPFHFDHFTADFFVAQKVSASIHLIPTQLHAFPKSLVDFLKEFDISFIFWVPTVMVNIANLNLLEPNLFPALKRIFFAGEVFPTKQLNIWRRNLPGVEFVNLYGPTEITVDCTYFVLNRSFDDDAPIPIGIPCANSDVFILTEENRLALPGQIGELCVRGSSLALGYYNNPEQTAKAFVQNPLNEVYPEIVYRTGDLVHTNELGEIMFDGRKDFQIKHQGYRIELAEIENAAQALIEIRNACVLYHKENKAIVLVFEASSGITSKQLRQALQSRIPKYMLPTVFVELDELPRNSNGKIDRQLLGAQYAS